MGRRNERSDSIMERRMSKNTDAATPLTSLGVCSDQDFGAKPAVATRTLQDEQQYRYPDIQRSIFFNASAPGGLDNFPNGFSP